MLPLSDQIEMELIKIVGEEMYHEFMNSPNVLLDMFTPRQILRSGRYYPLWEFISQNQSKVSVT